MEFKNLSKFSFLLVPKFRGIQIGSKLANFPNKLFLENFGMVILKISFFKEVAEYCIVI